jgi:hypothetical protein
LQASRHQQRKEWGDTELPRHAVQWQYGHDAQDGTARQAAMGSQAIRADRRVGRGAEDAVVGWCESGGVARETTCQRPTKRAIVNIVRC